jgi:hypothetical protein
MPTPHKPTRAEWRAEGKARRAAKAEAAKRTAEPTGRPTVPSLDLLTVADRQRVTRALGVDMPLPLGMPERQPDGALSARLADKYLGDLSRHHEREQRKRADALRPGSFQAMTATPADVQRRIGDLGLSFDVDQQALLAPVSKPLERPAPTQAAIQARTEADHDMQVARAALDAMRTGRRFDARKLTAGEMRALMQLRGVG